ncbi:MAG: hypothetical protein ACYCU3_20905 [Streptosporangiaceae bacterium]
MPPSDAAERGHHLKVLRELAIAINEQPDRHSRVRRLRQSYDNAGIFFDRLIGALPRVVIPTDKISWHDNQLEILRAYAVAERLW